MVSILSKIADLKAQPPTEISAISLCRECSWTSFLEADELFVERHGFEHVEREIYLGWLSNPESRPKPDEVSSIVAISWTESGYIVRAVEITDALYMGHCDLNVYTPIPGKQAIYMKHFRKSSRL